MVDVVGVVVTVGPIVPVTSRRSDREMRKRVITIVDGSETGVDLTIWDDMADRLNFQKGAVLALKGVRVT
jgi:ssDNA-binding replication factor A large subunit